MHTQNLLIRTSPWPTSLCRRPSANLSAVQMMQTCTCMHAHTILDHTYLAMTNKPVQKALSKPLSHALARVLSVNDPRLEWARAFTAKLRPSHTMHVHMHVYTQYICMYTHTHIYICITHAWSGHVLCHETCRITYRACLYACVHTYMHDPRVERACTVPRNLRDYILCMHVCMYTHTYA